MDIKELNDSSDIIERENVVGFKKDTPIELNLIQTAMFSKNKNAVKIKEVKLDNLDILIRSVKGHTIPNAFDEDVFFAILHLFVKFKSLWRLSYLPKTIYITYSDLYNVLRLKKQYTERIRSSLDKLASTSYKFTNTFLYRDVSCSFIDGDTFSFEKSSLNLDNTIFIYNNNAYNTSFNSNKYKIRTILFFEDQAKLSKVLSQLNLTLGSIHHELTEILLSSPIQGRLLPNIEDYKAHYLNVLSGYIIPSSKELIDDEFYSDIRDEISGSKISDYKVKKSSIISTFNLINFTEFRLEEINVSDMFQGAKFTTDIIQSVKAFVESKISGNTQYMLRIDLNNYMYENIVNKVYLLHSLDYLLDFKDKTARAIYLFIESSKGKSKRINGNGIIRLNNPNLIIVDAELLARAIPISIGDKQISSTINVMLRSFDYLKTNGYIKDYLVFREKPLRNTYFKVEFHEEQSRSHPEFSSYSVKVLPNKQDQDLDIPSEVNQIIQSLNGVSQENTEALLILYNENKDKVVTIKGKNLKSSLGLLIIRAIEKKINLNANQIRNLSGYLYHMINHHEVYSGELEALKQEEYQSLYGTAAKAQAKLQEQKNKDKAEKEKILEMWGKLSDIEKNYYYDLAKSKSKEIKLPNGLHSSIEKLPIHLFAIDNGMNYDLLFKMYGLKD